MESQGQAAIPLAPTGVRVLPDHIINRIAAGEVIERPSSVVRELLDNSLDAGATEIIIAIEEGGRRLIRVTDNGCAMSRDDALLAFERHATSKIRSLNDLKGIATLGFRGEALPSIAAISMMTLRTRRNIDSLATQIEYRGGTLQGVDSVPGATGTTIEVRNLFFNTPARKKFLKTSRTEELKIKQRILQSSLAAPRTRLVLIGDRGRELLRLDPSASSLTRALERFSGNYVSFERAFGGMKLCGLVSHPSLAQLRTDSFTILVNGRAVSDRLVLRAVREGFDTTLKPKEFPTGFISIELDPELVDVNVHPQKSEVRFQDDRSAFVAIREAVFQAVQTFKAPLSSAPLVRDFNRHFSMPPATISPFNLRFNNSMQESPQSSPVFSAAPAVVSESQTFRFSDLHYLGQLMECYLLCQQGEEFCVVDMHAAHERYNFNLLRNKITTGAVQIQELLIPLTIELSEAGVANCLEHQAVLSQLGFRLESFGEGALLVRAAPTILPQSSIATVIRELSAIEYGAGAEGVVKEEIDHLAARLACHASIRAGKQMTREEVLALFSALDSTEFSAACPHGRPVVVRFMRSEVERWFGRDR